MQKGSYLQSDLSVANLEKFKNNLTKVQKMKMRIYYQILFSTVPTERSGCFLNSMNIII